MIGDNGHWVLTRIRLLNFHNFQDETIRIEDAGHLFLLGDNGSGKTTVLDAVHYVLTAGNRMEFNSAARVAGARTDGRRAQGIVMRYNVDTGPLNTDGGVSYAALELKQGERALTLAVGLSTHSMEERLQRWGIIKEASLEEIPFSEEALNGRRIQGQKEIREAMGNSGFYSIGAYEKEVARRLFTSEDAFRETCEFLSMGKAYRELAASAGDYHHLFKRLLPQPKTDLFERMIESLRNLDEAQAVLEDMESKYDYLVGLAETVAEVTESRETLARYDWLLAHLELEELALAAEEIRARRRELAEEVTSLESRAALSRERRETFSRHLDDLRQKDSGGVVRQESELAARERSLEARQADLEARAGSAAEALDRAEAQSGKALAEARSLAGPIGKLLPLGKGAAAISTATGAPALEESEAAGLERLRVELEQLEQAPHTEAIAAMLRRGAPFASIAARLEGTLSEQRREEARLELAHREAGSREADAAEALRRLEDEREVLPDLPGFKEARAELEAKGLDARPLYEMLEWEPGLDEANRRWAEELIGEEILATFYTGNGDEELIRNLFARRFPGLRIGMPQANATPLAPWMRKCFSLEASHPGALSLLAAEMTASREPEYESVEGHTVLGFRAHHRRLWEKPARWVGAEGRRRALQERIGEAREALEARQGESAEALAALEGSRATLRRTETQRRQVEALDRSLTEVTHTMEQRFLAEAHERTRFGEMQRQLQELVDESAKLRERLADLRAIIAREGLQDLEERIRELEAQRRQEELDYDSLQSSLGGLRQQNADLDAREEERVSRERTVHGELAAGSEALQRFTGLLEDVAYYVLRTKSGQQFKNRSSVKAAQAETGRKEAALRERLSERLHHPRFGSVFGFHYESGLNALLDRRERPVAELVEEQRRSIDEQREVINEKTRELFKRIIVNELTAFFARHVGRLEDMVRRINALLRDRWFGNLRYQLKLEREERFKPFLEAILKHNPMDGTGEDELRQFIEEQRESILNAEADEVPESLDYRNWYRYNLRMQSGDNGVIMDRRVKSVGSGGEQAVPNYLLILTIAHFLYQGSGAKIRLLLFDEAFYGIDANRRDQLLGFAGDLGLQLLVASPDQDGVKREVRRSTTLLVVKDADYDVHLYPFHWRNPSGEQADLLEPEKNAEAEARFEKELGAE